MIILGVNPGLHDGSAALVVDGRLARVVEAERVTGSKRSLGRSPAPAVAACLAAEGLTLASVDVVAAGWNVPNFPDYPGQTYTDDELAAVYEWLLDPGELAGDVGRRAASQAPVTTPRGLAAYGCPQQGFPIRTDDGYSIDVSGLPAGPLPGNQESDLAEARLLDWFSEHHYPYRRGDRAEPMAYAHFAQSPCVTHPKGSNVMVSTSIRRCSATLTASHTRAHRHPSTSDGMRS